MHDDDELKNIDEETDVDLEDFEEVSAPGKIPGKKKSKGTEEDEFDPEEDVESADALADIELEEEEEADLW